MVYLTFGQHTITVKDIDNNVSDSICITVIKKHNTSNNLNLITGFPYNLTNNKGKKTYGFVSLEGSAKNVSFGYLSHNLVNSYGTTIPKRDFSIKANTNLLKPFRKPFFRTISNYEENSRMFYVANTTYAGNSYHEIQAKKYYQGNAITVWIPENLTFDYVCLDTFIQKIENIIIPRVHSLWGECADINEDGTLSILFCPSINEEKKAIGFFNSKDFFKKDTDIKSKGYNPNSNEMDIIYIGIPDENNSNYTINSLLATIAHEYTHAVNYTNKTWKHIYAGNETITQEDTFLDEGWSHLTESLCGFGSSGGNSSFINYYLRNPALYSLCRTDYLGNGDSVGQRGAICLFLYWLFIKAGGIKYNDDGITFIDNGGISFLRKMTDTPRTGWECIGEYFNKNTNSLFLDYTKELLSMEITQIFDQNATDPITNEKIFECNNIYFYNHDISFNILPWSIIPVSADNALSNVNTIQGEKLIGTVYLYSSD